MDDTAAYLLLFGLPAMAFFLVGLLLVIGAHTWTRFLIGAVMMAWAGSWLWLGYAGGSFDCGDEGCGTGFEIAAALVKWLSIALIALLLRATLSWLHRRFPGRTNARRR